MIQERNVKRFCCESPHLIENYHQAVNDKEHMWECHHRAEILPCGIYSKCELIEHGLYWMRPASELIFLRHDQHRKLHSANRKESTRKKIAAAITNNPLRSRPVVMYRISDGREKEFPSQHEACRWLVSNGIGTNPKSMSTHISLCCRGIYKSSYGCKWRFM